MKTDDIKRRVNDLLQKAEEVLRGGHTDSAGIRWMESGPKAEVRAASLSFLERVFGRESVYYEKFETATRSQTGGHFEAGVGILRAAKDEIDGGWLFSTKGLISAEIFSNYLEMASYLLDEGYKDPAAVIAGSTLEEHLRQLCQREAIPVLNEHHSKAVPVKASRLNEELTKSGVYGKLDLKQITGWLDLRNKAAHGHYEEYSQEQVKLMIQSIQDFISRTPI